MKIAGIHIDCTACDGIGIFAGADYDEMRCRQCDGLGYVYAAGGPLFGCTMTLGSRNIGETVELAHGMRARIAWHEPRPAKNVEPETTFVQPLDDFADPKERLPYPSAVGIRTVDSNIVTSARREVDDGQGGKHEDIADPLLRGARLKELV